MIILQILHILVWLLAVPAAIGMVPAYFVDKGRKYALLPLLGGYICMWAVFQMVCVPLVLAQRTFKMQSAFSWVVWIFGILSALIAVGSLVFMVKTGKLKRLRSVKTDSGKDKMTAVLWAVFACLLLAQVLAMIFLAFADGDDAYYIGVSSTTVDSNTMYMKIPYTGASTELDTRYGLAPMPVWIAFLARVTGIHTAAVAHIFVPVVLLLVTYGIYGALGQILCRDKKNMLPAFMIGISLLVIWGNYSFKTAETFLITRTSQGKSILGNVILPFLLFLLFLLIDRVREKKDMEASLWLLFLAASAAGCLCSSLGGVLIVMLMGIAGFYIALCYRKLAVFTRMIGCCLPALLFIVLYLWVQGI